MIVYFDLRPEYRQRFSDLLGSSVEELKAFLADIENEIAWYLVFGGLRESDLPEDIIRSSISEIHDSAVALQRAFEQMPKDVYGWLVEHAPVGTDYQQPFDVIPEPLAALIAMTARSLEISVDDRSSLKIDSETFVRKIASVCTEHFEYKPDMESDLFQEMIDIVFDALGVLEIRDTQKLIQRAKTPRQLSSTVDDDLHEIFKRKLQPPNYVRAMRKKSD